MSNNESPQMSSNDLPARRDDLEDEIELAFNTGGVKPEGQIEKIKVEDLDFPEITVVDPEAEALGEEVDKAFDDIRTLRRLPK